MTEQTNFLEEAKALLVEATKEWNGPMVAENSARFHLQQAQVAALIDIAESLVAIIGVLENPLRVSQ